MRVLLDTHVFIWWLENSSKLGAIARETIADPENEIWISAASSWEIAIKAALGRLKMKEPPELCLPREIRKSGFAHLQSHILTRFPYEHCRPTIRTRLTGSY